MKCQKNKQKFLLLLDRVGRQGTLLCKEINIGYLKRLNYLPLRGENLGLYGLYRCVLTKLNA